MSITAPAAGAGAVPPIWNASDNSQRADDAVTAAAAAAAAAASSGGGDSEAGAAEVGSAAGADPADGAEAAEREPTGDFVKDYLYHAQQLGIVPHPQLCRVKRPRMRLFATNTGEFVEDEDAEEEEEAPIAGQTSVTIRNHVADSGTLRAMCLALPSTNILTQLRLYNAGLTTAGLNDIAAALAGSTVTVLHVEYNPLEAAASPRSAAAVAAEGGGEENPGPDPSIHFAALLDLPLTTLSLRGNAIGAAGAVELAKKLYDHKTLGILNLFDNHIGADGAQALIDMLYSNRSITQLVLASNGIPAEVAQKALLPLCNAAVPEHVGQERQALGLAFSESSKNAKKKKKKRAGQGIDTELPVMFKNEEGVFMSEINGNVQALDLSFNPLGAAGLAATLAPLATLQGGAAPGGDPVGLAFLGLARVGAAEGDKAAATAAAAEALPQLQLSL